MSTLSTPQPTVESASAAALSEHYAAFLNYLSPKRLHSYIFHWLNHLTHQPPEHTQLFFEYLLQPSHRWVCTLPQSKTPTLVKVLAVQHAPADTNSRASTSRRATPAPKLTWVVQTAEGKVHLLNTLDPSSVGPFLSNPSHHNIPKFLLRAIATAPTEAETATNSAPKPVDINAPPASLVLAPVYSSTAADFPALNINDWQARIALQPTYSKSPTEHLSAVAYISYYHPDYGYMPRYGCPIFQPYYELTNEETFAIFQSLQTAVANLIRHSFNILGQLKTAFGHLIEPPTAFLPTNGMGPIVAIAIHIQSADNPELRLEINISLNNTTAFPVNGIAPELRFSFKLPTHTTHNYQSAYHNSSLAYPALEEFSPDKTKQLQSKIQDVYAVFASAQRERLMC